VKTIYIYLIFIFFVVCHNNASAQAYYSSPEPIDSTQFAYNTDWIKAHQLQYTAPMDTVRSYFQKAIKTFEKENNWEAYLEVATALLHTYHGGDDFKAAQSIGAKTLEQLRIYAPRLQRKAGQLVYNIGLAYPYPYKSEQALEYFTNAKRMVTKQPEPDTLLLGKIYSSAGMSNLQLEHFEKAWEYLQQAKYLLESQISDYEDCTEAWEAIDFYEDGAATSMKMDRYLLQQFQAIRLISLSCPNVDAFIFR